MIQELVQDRLLALADEDRGYRVKKYVLPRAWRLERGMFDCEQQPSF
jgi:hypothetical protein